MTLLLATALAIPAKNIGRFYGQQANVVSGMGIVTGLRGTGDTRKNSATMEALAMPRASM